MDFSTNISQDHEKTPHHSSSNTFNTVKSTISSPKHKITNSSQSLKTCSKILSLSTQNESIRLQYQIDLLQSENKSLHLKLNQTKQYYKKELKSRDDIILSMSGMMQDRELKFKKLLESLEKEKNSIIGRQESEKSSLKQKIVRLKTQFQTFDSLSLIQNQETEINHLRKILEMTEKENRELVAKAQKSDKHLSQKKWEVNEQQWTDACLEIGLLIDALSKLKNIIEKVLKKDTSMEVILRTTANDREEITKDNLTDTVKQAVGLVKGIQDYCKDIYAAGYSEYCSVQ